MRDFVAGGRSCAHFSSTSVSSSDGPSHSESIAAPQTKRRETHVRPSSRPALRRFARPSRGAARLACFHGFGLSTIKWGAISSCEDARDQSVDTQTHDEEA